MRRRLKQRLQQLEQRLLVWLVRRAICRSGSPCVVLPDCLEPTDAMWDPAPDDHRMN